MEREILLDGGRDAADHDELHGPVQAGRLRASGRRSWTSSPTTATPIPTNPNRVRDAAFQRDLVRSLKPGVPWMLMEQATDAVNWRPANPGKRAGRADGRDRAVDRARRRRHHVLPVAAVPRGQREVPLGDAPARRHRHAHLATPSPSSARASPRCPTLPAPGRDARVALVFDWENWWAVEERDHPTEIDYLALVARVVRRAARPRASGRHRAARAGRRRLRPRRSHRRCTCCATRARQRSPASSRAAARCSPGRSPTSSTARPVPRRRVPHPARPRARRALRGLRRARRRLAPAAAGVGAQAAPRRGRGRHRARSASAAHDARGHASSPRRVHAIGADVVATFDDGLAAGSPALTRHRHGAGEAWYVATHARSPTGSTPSSRPWWRHPVSVPSSRVCPTASRPPAAATSSRVINHGDEPVEIDRRRDGCRDRRAGRPARARVRRACSSHWFR